MSFFYSWYVKWRYHRRDLQERNKGGAESGEHIHLHPSTWGNLLRAFFFSDCFVKSAIQGLCLVDWGRGIDLHLFRAGTEFHGDCGTSGFRCVEMQEDRNWTYQVRTQDPPVVSSAAAGASSC